MSARSTRCCAIREIFTRSRSSGGGSLSARATVIAATTMAVAAGMMLIADAIGNEKPAAGSVTLDLGGPLAYYPLEPFLVDLTPTPEGRAVIRVVIVAQAREAAMAALKKRHVDVAAAILAHLRSLRRVDVAGRDGAERLRGSVRDLINKTIAPAEVRTVYFTEILLD